MIIASLLEQRRRQWHELESLCDQLEVRGRFRHGGAEAVTRFASLYRAACADLALADAYQLPPATTTYLHRLVARAHNNLYRTDRLDPASWAEMILRTAPRQIFADPCVRVAALLFFGLFSLAMALAYNEQAFPQFAETIMGAADIERLQSSFERPLEGSLDHYVAMAGYYIKHNTGIGLQCFAFGVLVIPCLFKLAYNGVYLGTAFGVMSRPEAIGGENFLQFVTAHGPFELTAIALAGGAGLRLGVGLFATGGLSRSDSLFRAANAAVPIMAASAVLFFLAALTEGFISPSPLPYSVKAAWAILSSGLISFYFVVLGMPRDAASRRSDEETLPGHDPLADEGEPTERYGGA